MSMPLTVLLFFLGMLVAREFSYLPDLWLTITLLVCSIFALFIPWLRMLSVATLGCSWFLLFAMIKLPLLPANIENNFAVVEGVVSSIALTNNNISSFNFTTTKINDKSLQYNLRIHWRLCPQKLYVGDYWRLYVKIKKPHALMNLGSFDIEKSFLEKHLHGSATVLRGVKPQRLGSLKWHFPVQQLRAKILEEIIKCEKNQQFLGIITALTIGMTGYISTNQWQVFRATGTNHLVAISGLHIGLVALFCAKIVGIIWNKIPNAPLYIPTNKVQAILGVLTALAYSVLSGLAASTQRAVIMSTMMLFAILSNRRISTMRSLSAALGLIILLDPFAVLSLGFWLSFLAVSCLLIGLNARIGVSNKWLRWGKPQWVVWLGMAPTLISFFGQITFVSFIANIIAIPIFSFVIIPCSLIGTLFLLINQTLGESVLQVALYTLKLVWVLLAKLSTLTMLILQFSYNSYLQEWFAHIGALLSMLPEGLLPRMLSYLWWLCCATFSGPSLDYGKIRIVVFDVGQGLATLIQTSNHVVLFDTGVKVNDSFDMGKAVILPYMFRLGIKRVDLMVISHGDNDHIGGAKAILQTVPVAKIITSVPERFKPKAIPCNDRLAWRWDGVDFRFLSPPIHPKLTGNNSSCVLKVAAKSHGVLLTGDIEQKAEKLLRANHYQALRSDIIVVPHHGSKTSSSKDFLVAVKPKYALFSYGYNNSYHHPHKVVIDRYHANHIMMLDTVHSGAITMTLSPDSDIVPFQEYRKKHHKFWHLD